MDLTSKVLNFVFQIAFFSSIIYLSFPCMPLASRIGLKTVHYLATKISPLILSMQEISLTLRIVP